MSEIIGLDVSQYQNEGNLPIDWQQALNAGARFAFIRAADVLFWDAWWSRNLAGAEAAGMPARLYIVWTPALDNATQLAFWRQHIGDAALTKSPFALDVELNTTGLDKAIVTNRLKAMLTLIHDTFGFYPVFYTGKWWTDQNLLFDPMWNLCPQWLADYYPPLEIPAGWTNTKIWQYTSSGDALLYGCHHSQNRVDLNYWIAAEDEFYSFWGVTPPPPPPPAIEPVKLKVLRTVAYRAAPGVLNTNPALGYLTAGDIITVYQVDSLTSYSVWAKHDQGWSAIVHAGTMFLDKV